MVPQEKIKELEERSKILRRHIVEMVNRAASGHPGGSLSAADIITVLYFYKMRHDPKNPKWADRDRFVLSKGHAAPVLYAALAECGYFPIKYLETLRQIGSSLQGHPDMLSLAGVEMTTGSLGQGLSAAVGMALAGRIDKKDYRIYCMIGDGESQEGQIWEAAMAAGHYKLDKLTVILDHNKFQIDGKVEDIKGIQPIKAKWEAFRWHVIENVDGHNIKAIIEAFEKAEKVKGKPVIIIAETVKGKGISFMEWKNEFHGKPPSKEELGKAREELK
ncbi:MAG: transketolase [Candidatus Saganbacteria bacterium]|nr:transketolase [Candidatus Saganbacteria bacterium]